MDAMTLLGSRGLEVAHRSIDETGQHAQPVTPRNYEIWLSYFTSSTPGLRSAVDELIAKGAIFDEATMDALYQRHFSASSLGTQVLETGSRIAHEIADALDALKHAGLQTERYGNKLDHAGTRLRSGAIDLAGLRQLVATLAAATTEMSEGNLNLSGKLEQSSAEMEQLRTSLREARAQALTDALTGVANRKMFDETLRLRCDEARTGGGALSLVICDIDHFKKFNDTWGHQTGDQVIRLVAGLLANAAMPDHLVARIGGEEFAIIMQRTSIERAAQICEEARLLVHTKRLVRKTTQEMIGNVSVSFGIASRKSDETVAQLIARADECLYLSKRSGRNRVSVEADLVAKAASAA